MTSNGTSSTAPLPQGFVRCHICSHPININEAQPYEVGRWPFIKTYYFHFHCDAKLREREG